MKGVLVLVAAGEGRRFGKGETKQLVKIRKTPLLLHTIRRFYSIDWIKGAVVGVSESIKDKVKKIFEEEKPPFEIHILKGGTHRSGTVKKCLEEVIRLFDDFDIILVHDAVRPLVEREDILKVAEKAYEYGVSVPGFPVRDTLKKVKDGKVIATVDRSNLWAVFTPQCFRIDIVKKLLPEWSDLEDITDDSMVAEKKGIPVAIVKTSPWNIKLTYPEDLRLFYKLLGD